MPAASSRISVTAKIAAYYRQFSDITFAAEAAKRIDLVVLCERLIQRVGHDIHTAGLSR